MMPSRRAIAVLLVSASLLWHGLDLLSSWRQASREQHARDFASYHYAVRVALDGGNPYERSALGAAARADETRKGVHPFFYPPPSLLAMLWTAPLDLVTAYRAWFWLDALFGLLAVLALWRWWRPLGPAVGVVLVASVATLTALPNNHLMGQMNLPVLLLVILGLWLDERGRPLAGGALLGVACMLKMSPALFVAWWLLRGRWTAVAAAVGAAILLTVASLPVAGPEVQLDFYTRVLPGFGSGSYNGLGVGIDLFGNHSLPNLWDALWPAGPNRLVLSPEARAASTATTLALVGGTGWLLRAAPADALARAGQVGAVAAVMLLVPVFTYEHHLVWLWPSAAVAVAALAAGRLGPGWALPLGLALLAWTYDLARLKELSNWSGAGWPVTAWVLRELKLAAIVILYAASLRVGRSRPGEESP